MPDRRHQTADFAIATFVKRNAKSRAVGLDGNDFEGLKFRGAVLQGHALRERLDLRGTELAANRHEIGFVAPKPWVLYAVREIPIARKDQETFGISVEATNGENADVQMANVVRKTGPALGVMHRADDAARFIPQQIDLVLPWLHAPATHHHVVLPGPHEHANPRGRAIDRDVARADQVFGLAACRYARLCQVDVKAQRVF